MMRSRLVLSLLAALALAAPAAAQAPAAAPQMAQLLFVQGAAGVELGGGGGRTLTLKGLSSTTLFFSDRPVRIAGHYRTEEYIGLPFTPLSFAGVARRTAYRTVVWGGAAAAGAAAASAYYHPPAPFYSAPVPVAYPAPVPTVNVTETVTPAAAPAPAVSTGQAVAAAKLKELKSLQSQGLITEAQYQAESQKLLNQIVQ